MTDAAKEVEVLARGVCVKDGSLLLCHTKGADNTYLPGGHVEPGEATRGALVREMMEEMGQCAVVGDFLGVVEHGFVQNGNKHHELNLIFLMDMPDLEASGSVSSCEDYIEFSWAPIAELAASDLEPAPLRELLPLWIEGVGERWGSTCLL